MRMAISVEDNSKIRPKDAACKGRQDKARKRSVMIRFKVWQDLTYNQGVFVKNTGKDRCSTTDYQSADVISITKK